MLLERSHLSRLKLRVETPCFEQIEKHLGTTEDCGAAVIGLLRSSLYGTDLREAVRPSFCHYPHYIENVVQFVPAGLLLAAKVRQGRSSCS